MVVNINIRKFGHKIYNGKLSSSMVLIFSFIAMSLVFKNISYAQVCYKQETAYLIQKIEFPPTYQFYIRFKHHYYLPYFYGYYIVNDDILRKFIKDDLVDFERAVILCDPMNVMFADSTITQEVWNSTRLKDLLMLDDSEIYEIGGGKYIIRKIKYAYADNTQVKVYIKGRNYFMWDDLQTDDTAMMNAYNATYEVGKLYGRDYYQCYHHLVAILPTPSYLQKNIWKRLYQLKHMD